MDKIKKFILQFVVLVVNAALIVGGVFAIKKQQDKQKNVQAQKDARDTALANQIIADYAAKAQQLESIVQNSAQQKTDSISNNSGKVMRQVPTVVTQTIPAKTVTKTSSKTTKSS